MKSLKTILAGALLMFSASVMAQATYTDAENNKYEFQKHWFLNLQGGAQYTLGEAKFKDLISPNVQLGLGYQFSPVFWLEWLRTCPHRKSLHQRLQIQVCSSRSGLHVQSV